MSIPAAYAVVVLIWSTTPLAIQWSGHDVGFLFGLASRMLIGLALLLCLHLILRKKIRIDRDAWRVYLPGGVSLWAAMSCVYLVLQQYCIDGSVSHQAVRCGFILQSHSGSMAR